jgi:hypothetical protein
VSCIFFVILSPSLFALLDIMGDEISLLHDCGFCLCACGPYEFLILSEWPESQMSFRRDPNAAAWRGQQICCGEISGTFFKVKQKFW